MARLARCRAAAALLVAVVPLAGCSSDDDTPTVGTTPGATPSGPPAPPAAPPAPPTSTPGG